MITKTRKWDRRKDGLYGYVYSSKTSWRCPGNLGNSGKILNSGQAVATKLGSNTVGANPGEINFDFYHVTLEGAKLGTKRRRD